MCLPDDFLDGICAMLTELVQTYRPVAGADILFPSDEKVIGNALAATPKLWSAARAIFVPTGTVNSSCGGIAAFSP